MKMHPQWVVFIPIVYGMVPNTKTSILGGFRAQHLQTGVEHENTSKMDGFYACGVQKGTIFLYTS